MSLELYLTTSEQTQFEELSNELKAGWALHPAVITYEDTPEKRLARFRIMQIRGKALRAFQEKVRTAATTQEVDAMVQTIDIDQVDDIDLTEILYAMGPELMEQFIMYYLKKASSDEDINGLAGFSTLRNLLFGPQ